MTKAAEGEAPRPETARRRPPRCGECGATFEGVWLVSKHMRDEHPGAQSSNPRTALARRKRAEARKARGGMSSHVTEARRLDDEAIAKFGDELRELLRQGRLVDRVVSDLCGVSRYRAGRLIRRIKAEPDDGSEAPGVEVEPARNKPARRRSKREATDVDPETVLDMMGDQIIELVARLVKSRQALREQNQRYEAELAEARKIVQSVKAAIGA